VERLTLIYHDIVPRADRAGTGFTGPGPDHYKVEPALFVRQIAAARAAALTFDDGGASALTATAPLLERHGRHGSFFVVTDRIGTPGFVDADGIRELRSRGHLVGSHGATHRPLTRLGDAELRRELEASKEALEELLGEQVSTLAIPGGFFDERVGRAAAAAGYTDVYTSEPFARSRRLADTTVHPRFSVVEDTTVEKIAALARADRRALFQARAGWETRKAAKRVAGPLYARVRRAALARR
jgi:peptidoglycan/xylan/chitin deacetylase (PgdA/CDA1 family)